MSHFRTPSALRHDLHQLSEEASHLLALTSEATDDRIAAARKRLDQTLKSISHAGDAARQHAVDYARAAGDCTREHPVATCAAAVGVGLVLGWMLTHRS